MIRPGRFGNAAVRVGIARFLAPVLFPWLVAGPVCAQQASEPAQLVQAAADAQLRADFAGSRELSPANLHQVMRRLRVTFYAFWVRSASVSGLNYGAHSGEWPGQSDADWGQVMCGLRIHAARNYGTDVAATTLHVDRLWMIGTPARVREVRAALEGVSSLSDVQVLSDEDYQGQRSSFQRSVEPREDLFPEDLPGLPGCEAGVLRIKGWRLADLDPARRRDTLEILRDVAAGNPQQPVEMRLEAAGTSTVREAASLVSTHDVARMWLRGTYISQQQQPSSVTEVYDLVFSSAAPALQEQLERSECRMQRMLSSPDPARLLIDLRAEFVKSATVDLPARDAARLLESPPAWLVQVRGLEFGRPGSLASLKADFARLFNEPIRYMDASRVTEACRRYAAER